MKRKALISKVSGLFFMPNLKTLIYTLIFILITSMNPLYAQKGSPVHINHYNQFLGKAVKEGGLSQKQAKTSFYLLDNFLVSLESVSETEIESWSRENQIVFWINAFNALKVKQIISKDLKESTTMDEVLSLKNKKYSLQDIRDTILRKGFRDERIMFALFDGAMNGPVLKNTAYEAENIDEELNQAVILFLKEGSKNKIPSAKKEIALSYLFEDFAEDFILNYGSYENLHKKYSIEEMAVLSFLVQYGDEETVLFLKEKKYKIIYLKRNPKIRLLD